MKKTIIIILVLILFPALKYAIDLEVGLFYGPRTVYDADVKNIYGNGTVYFPYLVLNIWKGLSIGGGYEGGYSKEAEIGLYNESSTLKVTGIEFFVGYQLNIKYFSPYLKIGVGIFYYKQTVENPNFEDYKVDHSQTTMTISGGIKFYPIKHFFLGGEIKFVPLKVKPYTEEVDLGGIRYLGCIGFTFNL